MQSTSFRGKINVVTRGISVPYHWNIKIIQLPPCIRLGQSQVDFLVGKRSLIPYIRQHTLCLCAEAAVVTAEKGDTTGLQKTPRSIHGWRRSLLACLLGRRTHGRLSSQALVWLNEPFAQGGRQNYVHIHTYVRTDPYVA